MSQLNFFMTAAEMHKRLEHLSSTGLVTLFNGKFFASEKPDAVRSLSELQDFTKLIIWVNNNTIEPRCSTQGRGDFEGSYLFSYYRDPIIELDNCKFHEKLISPGRLFYKTGHIENEHLGKLHSRVAKKTVGIFRKELTEISKPFRISPNVRTLIEKGFKIELGQGGFIVDQKNIMNFPLHDTGNAPSRPGDLK